MTKFSLGDDHWLENVDDKNWCICTHSNKKDGTKGIKELAYYPTLKSAWNRAVEMLSLKAENYQKLCSMVSRLEELKKQI